MTNGGSVGAAATDETDWDFFVSYAQTDRHWAEWIAWQLEETGGFRVVVQAWDMVPGTNLVVGMQNGVTCAQRMIAVVSEAYTHSQFSAAEWHSAFSADPSGFTRKLLVVRVEDCARPGLLGQVVPFDLFNVSEGDAREELVKWARLAVTGGRDKPASAPTFPGASPASVAPAFPYDTAPEPSAAHSPEAERGEDEVGGVRAPAGGVRVSAGRDIYGPGYAVGPTTYTFGARPSDDSK